MGPPQGLVIVKIFVYRDKEGASRIWQDNFLNASRELGVSAVEIQFDNLLDRPKSPKRLLRKIDKQHQPGDKFVARFNDKRAPAFKSLYPELSALFGPENIFPDPLAVELYNDKRKQADFFLDKGFPAPTQKWIESETELANFMQASVLTFPIVRKESEGAGSTGVSLIHSFETRYPFLAQEYCAHNSGDIRVMVVGDKVFGFARINRENDFRASGSGMIEYVDELPQDCVMTAHRISEACGFICMAYDFVLNNQQRWVVVEISYTFVSDPPRQCQYYYDAGKKYAKKQHRVGSVERLVLEKLISAGA